MIAEFAMFPLGGEHLSADIAKAIDKLCAKGVNFRLGPMGTAVEGETDEVFDAIRSCFECIAKDHERVIMTITVDSKKTKPHSLVEMVTEVERKTTKCPPSH